MSISVVRKESGVAKGSITCFWKPGYLPAILFLLLVSGAAGAQRPVSPEIEQTFNYLALQQKGDGSFEVVAPIASTFHLTSRISQSLYTSFPDSDTFSRAQSFLLTEQVDSVEGRARRLFISEFPEQSSEVLDAQNPDGGFGAEAGFSSNVLDTAFSLLAMKAWGAPVGIVARQVDIPPGESHIATLEIPADTIELEILIEAVSQPIELRIEEGEEPGYAGSYFLINAGNTVIRLDSSSFPALEPGINYLKFTAPGAASTISYSVNFSTPLADSHPSTSAIKYLSEAQNGDGGWGFQSRDGVSRLYFSYWASKALGRQVPDSTDRSGFVLGKERAGGGFSDEDGPTVFDTAVALLTLSELGLDTQAVAPQSIGYLENTRFANHSWENDAYLSVWAMDALLASGIPLAPSIISNGGAGVGENFSTGMRTVEITGFAPVGAHEVRVNHPSSSVEYDRSTGRYIISVVLAEGLNSVEVAAVNLSGVSGESRTINVTLDSTLSEQEFVLLPVFNRVGFAIDPANDLDATGLLSLLGDVAIELQKFNTDTGVFDSIRREEGGGFAGINFGISGLETVNVTVSGNAAFGLSGRPVSPAVIDLVSGLNMITIPNPPSDLTAFKLLDLIGDETVVGGLQRYNPVSGRVESAGYHRGLPIGMDFSIDRHIAYSLYMHVPLAGFDLPVNVETSISIQEPIAGATVTTSPVMVTGSVSGNEPLSVDVNGVPATLTGNTYSASVPLTTTGMVDLTATVLDDRGNTSRDAVTVTYDPVDYFVPVGGSVSGTRSFSAPTELLYAIAFYTTSITNLPEGVSFNTTNVQIFVTGEIAVDYTIAADTTAVPGIYTFQVVYELLDSDANPLEPLTENVMTFRIEIGP